MIRILKYEKASGSAKCQTGGGVGEVRYEAVVINPLRQIPHSLVEYEEERENGGKVKEKKKYILHV